MNSTKLVVTADGGNSATKALETTNSKPSAVSNMGGRSGATSLLFKVRPDFLASNVTNSVVSGQGIDTCRTMDPDTIRQIWAQTNNIAIGFYIGGETATSASCFEPSGGWLYYIACDPWVYMPIWDGLQAPCSGFSNLISSDPSTAMNQGISAAGNAVETLYDAYDLPNSIAYLDLEQYPRAVDPGGSASCSAAVTNYVEGWVAEMHNLGYSAGVYGNGYNLYDDISPEGIDNANLLPDSIWPAQYNGALNVQPITGLDTTESGYTYWKQNQRIHQYAGPTGTGFSQPNLVDLDFVDGYVVLPLPYSECNPPCTDPCNDTCPNYDPTQCGGGGTPYSCDDGCSCLSDDGEGDCCCYDCGCDEVVPAAKRVATPTTKSKRTTKSKTIGGSR